MTRPATGAYRPGSSALHDIDAAVKLICFVLLASAAAATDSAPGFAALLIAAAAMAYLTQENISAALSPVRGAAWLLLMIAAVNACFSPAEEPWLRWWIFTLSPDGLIRGIYLALRAALILTFGSVLAITTAPLRLIDALERLLLPLRALNVQTGRVALTVAAAVYFIPALTGETELIRRAQMARGARFDSRSYFEKARAAMPLIIPVFVAAFRRAETLALSLEARGYRPELPPAPKKHAKLTIGDWAALTVCAALCAMELVVL